MSFKATQKKDVGQLTSELKVFWETYFNHHNIADAKFGAKLGYMGKEFGDPRVPCVRFFPTELSGGKDYYLELFDWDQNSFHEGKRVLYKHKYNPEWNGKDKDKYVEVNVASLSTPTYAIKVSDLELVNETDIKSAYPEIKDSKEDDDEVPWYTDEELQSEMFIEQEDDHYTKMTIRDIYCMLNGVPMSNKKWLNVLIKNGKEWKLKKK